jgi:hypothetical protein
VSEPDWVSAHLHYSGDLDAMVIDAMGPLGERLVEDGLAVRWFHLRHWDGGPHLRMRVQPRPGRADEVRAAILDEGKRFFDRLPGTTSPTLREYTDLAGRTAAWEGSEHYLTEPRPDNTVEFVPYEREHGRYGHGASITACERHFAESSTTALALLRRGADLRHRGIAALSAIALAWFTCEPDAESLRAMVAAQRSVPPSLAELSPAELDVRYRHQRDTLVPLVDHCRSIAAAVSSGLPSGASSGAAGMLTDWSASVHRLRDALAGEITAGRFAPPARGWEGGGAVTAAEPGIRVLPVLDICAHLFCNRLGVSLVEEAFMRYLLARTVLAAGGAP